MSLYVSVPYGEFPSIRFEGFGAQEHEPQNQRHYADERKSQGCPDVALYAAHMFLRMK